MTIRLAAKIALALLVAALIRLVIEVIRVPANLRISAEEWNEAAAQDRCFDQLDRPSTT
jgi:hypothetical protein